MGGGAPGPTKRALSGKRGTYKGESTNVGIYPGIIMVVITPPGMTSIFVSFITW